MGCVILLLFCNAAISPEPNMLLTKHSVCYSSVLEAQPGSQNKLAANLLDSSYLLSYLNPCKREFTKYIANGEFNGGGANSLILTHSLKDKEIKKIN